MIDFGADINTNFGYHRFGWNWVVDQSAKELHCADSSLRLYTFLDCDLLFKGFNSKLYSVPLPHKDWIGIIHLPPNVPYWFSYSHQIKRLKNEELLIKFFENCKGIICLSSYLKDYLEEFFQHKIPIHYLPHPVQDFNCKYDIQKIKYAIKNDFKMLNLVQMGYWLRRLEYIHRLAEDGFHESYNLIQLGLNNRKQYLTLLKTLKISNTPLSNKVFISKKLSQSSFDSLLTNSLPLIPLYDTSANNSLVECIGSRTPCLIQKHPATIEYLGEDYPLYFDNYDELISILKSPDLCDMLEVGNNRMCHIMSDGKLNIESFISRLKYIIAGIY